MDTITNVMILALYMAGIALFFGVAGFIEWLCDIIERTDKELAEHSKKYMRTK